MQQRPIQIIVASNVAVMAVGCLFLFQYWRLGAMVVFWSLVAALAIAGLNLAFLVRTRRIKLCGYISASVLFALLVVAIASSGGFYDPGFAWLYVVPVAAAFLVDLTALVVFLALVLATTVVFWLLPGSPLPNLVPADMHHVHSLFNRLATVLSLGVITALFVRAQYLAMRLLRRTNLALKEEAEAHTRTTTALAESEAQFRDLIENSADMIWTHDLTGTILSANESFIGFLGFPVEEVIGSGGDRFLQRDSVAKWSEYLKKIAEEASYRGLMTFVNRDGEVKVLEFHNTLRDDGVQSPLVRTLARDVSRQVASQEALRSRVDQEQLMVSISTRFIDTAADQLVPAIAVALGEIGVFLDCDRLNFFLLQRGEGRFKPFGQWSRDSARGDADADSGAVAIPWLFPRLEQFETIAVSRLSDLAEEGRADLAALLGDDVRSATIVPVFGREGLMGLLTLEAVANEREWLREHQALAHIAGMVFGNAIMRARDQRRALRLESEIQQARKMESLGLIAGGIAHDFNNLLMVVLGNTSVAMSQVQEGTGAQEALQAIDSSARRAAKLTAQMLAYAGGAAVDRRATALNELVELELEQIRSGTRGGVEIHTSLGAELPEIFADPALVRQLLRALVDNSLEAVGEDGGTVRIETTSVVLESSSPARGYRPIRNRAAAGTYGVLEVGDSGPGIEAGALQKIFDPFFSTKFAGRGLGLAAALGVVRGHEGLIEVESDDSGTRIRVFIPVARSGVPSPSQSLSTPAAEPARGDDSNPAILVLEPDPAVLAVLGDLLTSGGFEAVGVRTAQEASGLLAEGIARFRAVVADLKAVEASDSLLAARWRTESIPWIFSSDERKGDISARLVSAGASQFLSKPFDGRKLLSLLEGLLREYGLAGTVEA
ncbi:MAG: PAS domain S-box protein [bacterium]|nr:PAS domain S-box protein [bacterium]